jgi:hypothetical protein
LGGCPHRLGVVPGPALDRAPTWSERAGDGILDGMLPPLEDLRHMAAAGAALLALLLALLGAPTLPY